MPICFSVGISENGRFTIFDNSNRRSFIYREKCETNKVNEVLQNTSLLNWKIRFLQKFLAIL